MKVDPARLKGLEGPERVLKQLELMDKAASSISDGDLVDAMIHG
jgi:replication factor C subunit 1